MLESASVPAPALVRPKPLPPTGPLSVSVLAETVIVGVAVSVTGAVLRSRLLVPVKVKLPPIDVAVTPERTKAEPFVLLSVPPLIDSEPAPREPASPILSVPPETVVPPV